MHLRGADHGAVRAALSPWCADQLGSPVREVVFEDGWMSAAFGVVLADGGRYVVKIRPRLHRLAGCHAVHEAMWRGGFPCAEPLLPPTPYPVAAPAPTPDWVASVERFVTLAPVSYPSAEDSATGLAALVTAAPAVADVPAVRPNPSWTDLRHPGAGRWPDPGPGEVDLNAAAEPDWLRPIVGRVRARALRSTLPDVLGHGDWEPHNLRLATGRPATGQRATGRPATGGLATGRPETGRLAIVLDWDSVVALPEAAVAGLAASVFRRTPDGVCASLPDSAAFLDAYQHARGTPFSVEESQLAWAASLWVLAHEAKGEYLHHGDSGPMRVQLHAEATTRLARAGA